MSEMLFKMLVDIYLSDIKHDFKVSDITLDTITSIINIPDKILTEYVLPNGKINTKIIASENDLLFKYINIICDNKTLCKDSIKTSFLKANLNILDYLLYLYTKSINDIIVEVGFNKYSVSFYDQDAQIPDGIDSNKFILLPDMTRINLLSILKLYSSIEYIGSTTPMIFDSNNIVGHTYNCKQSSLFKHAKYLKHISSPKLQIITDYHPFSIVSSIPRFRNNNNTTNKNINTKTIIPNTNTIIKNINAIKIVTNNTNNNNTNNDKTSDLTKLLLTNYDIHITPYETDKEILITINNIKLDKSDDKLYSITMPGFLSNSNFMNMFSRNKTTITINDSIELDYTILKTINMLCKRLSDSCQSLYCTNKKYYLDYHKQNLQPLFYTEDRIALLQALVFGSQYILTHNKTKFIRFTLIEQNTSILTQFISYLSNYTNNDNINKSNILSSVPLTLTVSGGAKTPKTKESNKIHKTTASSKHLKTKASSKRPKTKASNKTPYKYLTKYKVNKSNKTTKKLLFNSSLSTPTTTKIMKRLHTQRNSSSVNNAYVDINNNKTLLYSTKPYKNDKKYVMSTLKSMLIQLSNLGTCRNMNISQFIDYKYDSATNKIILIDIFFKYIEHYKFLDSDNLNSINLNMFLLNPNDYIKDTYNIYDCDIIKQNIKTTARYLLKQIFNTSQSIKLKKYKP